MLVALRQRRFPNSQDVPAASVEWDSGGNFEAVLESPTGSQRLGVSELLSAAFEKRLKFGIPIGTIGTVSLMTGQTQCWRCKRKIEIVTRIKLEVGPHDFEFSVADLTGHAGVHGTISRYVGPFRPFGAVKIRASRTQGRRYLSNGCTYCNALYGQFHEHAALDRERGAKRFRTTITAQWIALIQSCDYEFDSWAVMV